MDSAFHSLHQRLQDSTVSYARDKLGDTTISQFTPWLCFLPLVPRINPRLIRYTPPVRGGLVTDDEVIGVMAAFLAADGKTAIIELPGDPQVWLPATHHNSKTIDGALRVIRTSDRTMWQLYDLMVEYVVPLGGGRNRGYSTHLIRGAIFRSLPEDNDEYDVAIDIMHEVGHQVLQVWQSVDPILTTDPNAPVFSQIRQTDRPAIQSFHAAVALGYMRYLQRSLPDDPGMQAAAGRRGASYSRILSYSLELAIESLRDNCQFTDVGEVMLREMEAVI